MLHLLQHPARFAYSLLFHTNLNILAAAIGKSERTIKTRTVALQEKGYLRRANGKRSGHWEVLVKLS